MLLKRMSFPRRYSDMIYRFGRTVPVLSMVTNQVVDYIYQAHGQKIKQWNNRLLNPAALQTYADAIERRGAALDNCFGFVDGTVRPICRPNEHQRTVYNGHKRGHALKFQSVTIPSGPIANLYGPVGKVFSLLCRFFIFKKGFPLLPKRSPLPKIISFSNLTRRFSSYNKQIPEYKASQSTSLLFYCC